MRKLVKGEPPQVLIDNAEAWAIRYSESGGTTSPWSHVDIKVALKLETSGKCAYCEGEFLAVSFGDIEHIRPKSKFPELVVTWENLTLACSRCNQNKSSKFDADLEWINPYVDDPADHIMFLGPFAYPLSDRGDYAIRELDLNHAERVEARQRAIQTLAGLIDQYTVARTDYSRRSFRTLIERVIASGEYSVAVSSYAASPGIARRLQASKR